MTDAAPTPEAESAADTASANDEESTNESDWGFDSNGKGISKETKIGLALILVLCGAFAFVVYTKVSRKEQLANDIETVAPSPDATGESPSAPRSADDPAEEHRQSDAPTSFRQPSDPSLAESSATASDVPPTQSEPAPQEFERYAANAPDRRSEVDSRFEDVSQFETTERPTQAGTASPQDFNASWETDAMSGANAGDSEAVSPETHAATTEDAEPFEPFASDETASDELSPASAEARRGASSQPAANSQDDFGAALQDELAWDAEVTQPFPGDATAPADNASRNERPPEQSEPAPEDGAADPVVDDDPFAAQFEEPTVQAADSRPTEAGDFAEGDDFGSAASMGQGADEFSPSSPAAATDVDANLDDRPFEESASESLESIEGQSEPHVEFREIEPAPNSAPSENSDPDDADRFGDFQNAESESFQAGSRTNVSRSEAEPPFDASTDDAEDFAPPISRNEERNGGESPTAEFSEAPFDEDDTGFGFEEESAGDRMPRDQGVTSQTEGEQDAQQARRQRSDEEFGFERRALSPAAVPEPSGQFEPNAFEEPESSTPISASSESATNGQERIPSSTSSRPNGQAETSGSETYTVQNNDNYWKISRKRYGTARYFQALALYNKERVPDPTKMRPGIKISTPPRDVLESKFPRLFSARQSDGQQTAFRGDRVPSSSSAEPFGYFVSSSGQPMYRVGADDTLTEISQNHLGRTSRWRQIYEMNRDRLQDPHKLQVGTVLRLPTDASRNQFVRTSDFSDIK